MILYFSYQFISLFCSRIFSISIYTFYLTQNSNPLFSPIKYLLNTSVKIFQRAYLILLQQFQKSQMRNRNQNKISPHEKLRQQIRDRYLKEVFDLKRARIIPSQIDHVFMETHHSVALSKDQPINLILINKLLSIYDNFPYHHNTFTIIGNYLLDHPSAQRYIIPRMLSADEQSKKIAQWSWVIALGMSANPQYDADILNDYDQAVSQMIQLAENGEQFRKSIDLLLVLLNIVNKSSSKYFYPCSSVLKLQQKLPNIDFSQIKQDLKYILVEVCLSIMDGHFTLLEEENQVDSLNLQLYMNVSLLALSEFPNFRAGYLSIFEQLSLKYCSYIEHVLCRTYTGKNILRQILYLYDKTQKHKRQILRICRYWVHMFSLENLVQMLNQAIHIYLIESLIHGNLVYQRNKGAVFNKQNEGEDFEESLSSMCLKTIKALLDRLREKDEQRLLENVLTDIENREFQKWVHQFFNERHEKDAEDALTELVDDYYSEDLD